MHEIIIDCFINICLIANKIFWKQTDTCNYKHSDFNVKSELFLTTGLSMMPLRKMRSRSLAVVELVLSLSVSRAWCIAAYTNTNHKKKEEEKTYILISKIDMENKTNLLARENERRKKESTVVGHVQTEWDGREHEGPGRQDGCCFISFPKQFYSCQSLCS